MRDFGSWHRGFEIFRERYAEDFTRFDREIVEELVEKQEFVGAFYEADGTNFEITSIPPRERWHQMMTV